MEKKTILSVNQYTKVLVPDNITQMIPPVALK